MHSDQRTSSLLSGGLVRRRVFHEPGSALLAEVGHAVAENGEETLGIQQLSNGHLDEYRKQSTKQNNLACPPTLSSLVPPAR